VLTGPPELGKAVSAEPALSSRVESRVQVQPMDAQAAEDYLRHRIRAAEGNPAILESGAVDALVKLSAGNPRRLNDLADGALFEAHLAGRVAATGEDVAAAASELELAPGGAAASASGKAVIQPERSADLLGDSLGAADAPDLLTPAEDLFSRLPETPPASGGMADQTTILSTEGDDAADDLSSLLADAPKSDGAASGAPDATVAMLDGMPIGAAPGEADAPRPAAAAAPKASAAPAARTGGPSETVALFAEASEGEGELDDLFADLVQED
jgi:hypothetical protein